MMVLRHRGGPMDGEFFIVNQSAIGHIDPDPPGSLVYMRSYQPQDSPIAVVENMETLANRFALRRLVHE